jgi:hypothetical protein
VDTSSTPQIVASDRMDEGLLIFFSDGRSAFYSADLLYSMIELAKELEGREPEE